MRRFALLTIVALAVLVAAPVGAVTYSLIDLGTFGGATSVPMAISNTGKVVGYAATATSSHAFLYSGGPLTDLGSLGGSSGASAVNGSGQVTGSSEVPGGFVHAFLYSGGAMTDLGTLGGPHSYGYAINGAGHVVGSSHVSPTTQHAFLYSGGALTDLGPGEAYAINDSDQIIGLGSSGGFLYSLGMRTELPTLGGAYTQPRAISSTGKVTGGSEIAGGATHAFIYSAGAMTDLGTLPGGLGSFGLDINAAGHVVGVSSVPGDVSHAFIYTGGPLTDLGTLSGGSSIAHHINATDQVAGFASPHYFIWSAGVMTDLGDWGGASTDPIAFINDGGYVTAHGLIGGNAHAFITRICGNAAIDPGETCDDGNTTTGDCCSSLCVLDGVGTACNDGLFCDGTDTCNGAGGCVNHTGNPCTGGPPCAHTCNEAADNCNDLPGTSCADGLFCTGADTCLNGTCSVHAGDPCAAGAQCQTACNEAADNCLNPNGSACNDGNPCSVSDVCNAGTCSGTLSDTDSDGVPNGCDNCSSVSNPDQRNSDGSVEPGTKTGDVCDQCPDDPTNLCNTTKSTSGTIGSAGGTLTTPDGSVQVTFPPGDFSGPSTVSVTGFDGASGVKHCFGGGNQGAICTAASECPAGSCAFNYGLGTTTSVFSIDIQPERQCQGGGNNGKPCMVATECPGGTCAALIFANPVTVAFKWPDLDNDGQVDGTGIAEGNLKIFRNGATLFGSSQTCNDFTGAGCTAASCCNKVTNTWAVQRLQFSEYALGRACAAAEEGTQFRVKYRDFFPDSLQLKGTLTLAPGTALGDVDPSAHGLRLVVDDLDGSSLDVMLPAAIYDGTMGWSVNGTGTRWVYKNKSASPPGGITQAVLQDKSKTAPGLMKFQFKGRNTGSRETALELAPMPGLVLPYVDACYTAQFPGPDPAPSCRGTSGNGKTTITCK